MGGLCCCQCTEDFEAVPNNPANRQCLRQFFHQIFSGYNSGFQRLDSRLPGPVQALIPLSSNSSIAETDDNDQVHHRMQRDGLVSRREKNLVRQHEDSQVSTKNSDSSRTNSKSAKKWNREDAEAECGAAHKGSVKCMSTEACSTTYGITGSEDEDVCPTCLDDYTPENPKIVAKCSHHFHLGCIFEWMERSDYCPVCGMEMEFCESP